MKARFFWVFGLITVFSYAVPVLAQGTIVFTPNVPLPGMESGSASLSNYIIAIYRYGIGLAAALAVMMSMIGGFIWLTSAGSPDRVSRGKEYITAALTGLVLALFSYLILYIINPQLINLQDPKIETVADISGAIPQPNFAAGGTGTGASTGQSSGLSPAEIDSRLRSQYGSLPDDSRPPVDQALNSFLFGTGTGINSGFSGAYDQAKATCGCTPTVLVPEGSQPANFNPIEYATSQGYSPQQYQIQGISSNGFTGIIVWRR